MQLGPGIEDGVLVAVILSVIITIGFILGIILLLCTMKTKSHIFSCYHVSSRSRNTISKQYASDKATQQTVPVDSKRNEAYRHTHHSNRDCESFHRRPANTTCGQNDCSFIDYSQLPADESRAPHLYDTVPVQNAADIATTVNSVVDCTTINIEPEASANPTVVSPQLSESVETFDNEYIEVFHKNGTLV